MRTLIIVLAGFALLAGCLLIARLISGSTNSLVTAAKVFIALWLMAAGINMWIGVSQAGYSIVDEFPIFLLIFAIPAVVAGYLWRRFSRAASAQRGSHP